MVLSACDGRPFHPSVSSSVGKIENVLGFGHGHSAAGTGAGYGTRAGTPSSIHPSIHPRQRGGGAGPS